MPQGDEPEWQAMAQKWQNWIGGITTQNKWVAPGQQLTPAGKVVRVNGIITDGPYTEIKETLFSYCQIKATSLAEAAELAQGCPILLIGGNVEVREIAGS